MEMKNLLFACGNESVQTYWKQTFFRVGFASVIQVMYIEMSVNICK